MNANGSLTSNAYAVVTINLSQKHANSASRSLPAIIAGFAVCMTIVESKRKFFTVKNAVYAGLEVES